MGLDVRLAKARVRRKMRIRKKVSGDAARPRLTVFRSTRHIYAQVIDDVTGQTLVEASTLSAEVKSGESDESKIEAARTVGRLVAERALAQSINKVVFDRNGFLYHGRIQALADAAREAGLEF